uniref:Uncharacterized protein n=1 Tax=Rhizophora mucronata TaxID=61149 RepID=A0A2P2NBX9_RHIMU
MHYTSSNEWQGPKYSILNFNMKLYFNKHNANHDNNGYNLHTNSPMVHIGSLKTMEKDP